MKTAMIFPGQGSQYVGMGKDIFEAFPAVAALYREADEILGFPISRVSFQGDAEFLTETRNAQPAILLHSIAVYRILRDEGGIEPAIVAGHSLGEYSALVAAGVLEEMDALRIVRRRGELMFEAGIRQPGTMAAVIGLDRDVIASVCREVSDEAVVVIANVNSPGQIVISGHVPAVETAMEVCAQRGAKKVVRLNVSGAFHSPLLEESAGALMEYIRTFPVRDARIGVICNADARIVRSRDEILGALSRQLTSPVLWSDSMNKLLGEWDGAILEVGPGKVLAGLTRRIDRGRTVQTVGTRDELAQFAAAEPEIA
jgi:[acyl-carrier-protein] S-malonyltransferase